MSLMQKEHLPIITSTLESVKAFAVTVHFYSPQAYEYLRTYLHLPNPATIRRWAASLNCEPGFLSDVITTLGDEVAMDEDMRDVCVMFDALSIKKECVYDKKAGCFAGGVNFGNFLVCKGEMATEALVFMVVGVKGHWKRPIGYFLRKADGMLQSQLVKHAVCLRSEKGFNVVCVTCDGSYANQATAKILACSLDVATLKSSFPHPEDPSKEIHFIFDACHLLKCVRNCLGDLKVIKFRGQEIKWSFIEKLHNVQMKDDLHLANKISNKHINYVKAKMNVRLAAQTLSNSVADAIDFMRDDECHPDFINSEATCHFIRNVDQLFDLCNSRNPIANGLKSRIDAVNLKRKTTFFQKLCDYIKELTDVEGKLLMEGRRKTPFLGFIMTAESLCKICEELLTRPNDPLKYVLTFKFSQDHLETFFSRLRRKGGWNNNPNALQLKWSMRSLLLHNGVTASKSANSVDIDCQQQSIFVETGTGPEKMSQLASKYADLIASKSPFHEKALYYIAVNLCRRLVRTTKCSKCANALFTLACEIPDIDRSPNGTLVRRNDRGGLVSSNDFFLVVLTTDRELRRALLSNKNPLGSVKKTLIDRLKIDVCQTVRHKVFSSLSTHFIEDLYLPSEEDHGVQIIKTTVELYVQMMLKHHDKLMTERFLSDNLHMRQNLTKQILFHNQ